MTYIPMQDAQREDISIQQQQLILLRIIAYHLGTVTGEVLKEDDLNA